MNSRCLRITAAMVVVLLFAFTGFAQQESNLKWKAASLDGTSGLFKTWDAENLRQGEINFTLGYDMFHRDPGKLTVGRAPVGAAFGLFDRFELFGSWDIQRHITADDIATYRGFSTPVPAMTPDGVIAFTQVAPFMNVPVSTGRSDVHFGIKYNILSERRGDSLSMALAGFGTIPGQRNINGLNRGLSSGAYAGGFAWLLSKTVADTVRFHFNMGTNLVASPSDIEDIPWQLATLQDEFIYRGGAEMAVHKAIRVIAELDGKKYYGSSSDGLNPKSPLDVILGIRFFPAEWASLGAGYQVTLHQTDANGIMEKSGFVVQGTLGTRKNDPPTVTCAVAKASILQGDTTTVRASAIDPDGDVLTYSWNASGGKIDGTGDTVTFNATGLAPGKYTVTNTVADKKKHEASCTAAITVLKRNIAPTVTVEPSSFTVTQGESANLRCVASDANNDPLTYTWSVDGQSLAAAGPQVTFGSEGRKPGTYNVQCSVSDGEATASALSTGTVRARVIANKPPVIECQTTTMDVASGGSIELRAKASDPDGDKLTYSWSSTGGAINGSGETATFNAADVKAGSYTATVTVDDGRGLKASCSMTINVSERLSVTKDKCGYFAPAKDRVDNCAKAILDDLAVRMKNDPKLRANVIGYTDASKLEAGNKGLGEKRAKAVAAYLEKQGVEISRITITDGGANNPVGDNKTAAGRTLNRRVEIELSVR
jgi:outer membrane protein OmpA-like peptidoglycan-associated protein